MQVVLAGKEKDVVGGALRGLWAGQVVELGKQWEREWV
jgi:hypothetical protein